MMSESSAPLTSVLGALGSPHALGGFHATYLHDQPCATVFERLAVRTGQKESS